MPIEHLDWPSLKRLLRFGMVVLFLLGLAGLIYDSLLVPILAAGFFTYLQLHLVDRLERRGLPRSVAALLIIVGSLGLLTIAVVHLTPLLYAQVLLLAHLLPGAVNNVLVHWLPVAERYVTDLGLIEAADVHDLFAINHIVARVAAGVQGNLSGLWKTGTSLLSVGLYAGLTPILNFFMVKDYHRIMRNLRLLVPQDLIEPLTGIRARLNATFRSVLQGQVIVAAILGVLYMLGLTIAGLQSALVIGLVAGICRIIPYLDVVVGLSLSAIVILSNSPGWGQVLSVALVFLVVQTIDGAFITPQVIGERIGLHPILVILSVLAFGDWFGFWGVLLAIPMAAMVKVMIEMAVPYYRASRAYRGE